MSNLTEHNIEFIIQAIQNSNIESIQLKEDLIDHFCCAIEEEIKKGISFEKAYEKAFKDICPDGFNEIQQESIYLLTSKKDKTMKQLMYVSGYLSAIGITTTLFMKLNHLPYGAIALYLTTSILALLFLPSLFINLYKRELTKSISNKLTYIGGFIGVILFIAFVCFKLAHWPGTATLFLASVAIINFAFFPSLFFKMYKKSVE